MNLKQEPRGWQLHHHEQLFIRANTGAPTIRLKFFHYPSYRQTVQINQPPDGCKLKTKGLNAFFLFQQKVHTKDMISLERIISVFPQVSTVALHESWGRISEIPLHLQRKYTQHFSYWPTQSTAIREIANERWFTTDDLTAWVHDASRTIIETIKHPENQEKRLGADQAVLSGRGDCDEYTDLLMTLCRMRGIPCRRLTGYVIKKENEPEPHAWGELLSPTKGWIPVDLALRNIGRHSITYVINKIEEFNPALADYQVLRQTTAVHYHWERPLPLITPLCE
jgi:hypothetical protein